MAVEPVEHPHQVEHIARNHSEVRARPHVGPAAGMARLNGLLVLGHFPLEIGKGKLGKPHADEELPLRFGQGQHRLDRGEEGLQGGTQ